MLIAAQPSISEGNHLGRLFWPFLALFVFLTIFGTVFTVLAIFGTVSVFLANIEPQSHKVESKVTD